MEYEISNQVMDRLQACVDKARAMGASGAKISYGKHETIGCQFEAGRLKTADSKQSVWYHLEVLSNGKLGRAGGNNLDDLEDMLQRAIATSKVGSAAHFDCYPAPSKVHEVKTYSPKTAELSIDTLIEGSRSISDRLKEYEPDLHVMAGGDRGVSAHALVTSGGVRYRESQTNWSLGAYVQRTEGTDMVFSGSWRGWRDLNELFDPDYILGEIVRELDYSKKIVDAPTGDLPIFVHPDGLQMFLWSVMEGVNGRNVAKGESPLIGRLGEQILDPAITVIDDPHLDYDNGAASIDDYGIPTKEIAIIRNGVLESYLYDYDTAGMAGVEPTGNNGCRPYSTTVPAGTKSKDELLSGIADGLYIRQIVGFGQSNIINGDFSGSVGLGFRIKDGKVVGRVKDVMIAGNIYDILKSGVQLSKETDPIARMPYAVIPGVSVSA